MAPPTRRSWLPLLALILPLACGGSGDGSRDTPSASPSPVAVSGPCAGALAASGDVLAAAAPSSRKRSGPLSRDVRDPRELLWRHRLAESARAGAQSSPVQLMDRDVGDIAVIEDDGTLLAAPNPFDLRGTGLRFRPNGSGGYDVSRMDGTFRSRIGQRVPLGDDDTTARALPFAFPFFGRSHSQAFVNSDGNLTFERGDGSSEERGVARFLSEAPRVALFYADLDPTAGGGIFFDPAADALTVTWCAVRGFDSPQTFTGQTSLLPDGTVEMKYGEPTTLGEAVVGVSPGATGSFTSVDLSAGGGGPGAVGERFAQDTTLDLAGAARRFLSTHDDVYDQLVFWTDVRAVEGGTFAFESTIRNDIRGIGLNVFDFSSSFGSGGTLQSLVMMDRLGKYPEDPTARILGVGESDTLGILGQETGHRWGAFLRFRDAAGRDSDLLLGRADSHWSFFFDSDASVMEGNDIEDLGGGSFRTVATEDRYCAFDLYAMGVMAESEVPPSFFVANPSGTLLERDSAPRTGVSFTGTRRDVRIEDIVAAMGRREPPAGQGQSLHTQAFVYVVGRGRAADAAAIAKLERIRAAWQAFFPAATGGRMGLDTRLR